MTEHDAPTPRPKRLVVVMDGTWNSPATPSQRDDGDEVFKPTNPLKTCRAIKDLDDVCATLLADAQPADGDTVTIDGKRYTFETTLSEVDGHVRIGDDEKDTLENLHFAINKKRHRSARYADATVRHPSVTAVRVAGDRRSLDLVPTPRAGSDPFATESTGTGFRWVCKDGLAHAVRERGHNPADGTPQIVYYDVGVGALRKSPGLYNRIHGFADRIFGGARGAGFEANVEDGYQFLCLNYREGDEIYCFGFSRGASSVRGLCRFLDWMGGLLPPEDSYWIPRYFDAFLAGGSAAGTRQSIVDHLRQRRIARGHDPEKATERAEAIAGRVIPARVRFLGVWDSVLAIGERRERPFFGPTPPARVDHARQALAIDEVRPDFEPRIWSGTHPANPDQTLEQRWFPGVHSNIGGGYVDDGLANIALHWVLKAARDAGLGLDWSFLRHYSEFPGDRLYDSNSTMWKVIQVVTFKKSGIRPIRLDAAAGLSLDASVFHRLAAAPDDEDARLPDDFALYRPQNLLRCLAEHPDLDALIAATVGLEDDFELSEDVRAAIRSVRRS